MNNFIFKYLGVFFLLISFFCFFSIIYLYYFENLTYLNNYIVTFLINLVLGIFLTFNKLIKPVKLRKSNWTKSDMNKFCRFVEKLSSIIGVKSCFVKSITKRNFLLHRGYKCEMYIGVSLKDKFKSHSWLVSEEINCFESPDNNMKVLKYKNLY